MVALPLLHVLIVLALGNDVAAPPPAQADARAQAKQLLEKGTEEFGQGRYQAALDAFSAAYDADPVPGFLFNIGQCHRKLHHWKRAQAAFERYLAEKPSSKNAPEVRELIAEARAHDQASGDVPPAAVAAAPPPTSPPPSNEVLFHPMADPGSKPWIVTGVGAGTVVFAGILAGIGFALANQDHTYVLDGITVHSISEGQANAANTLGSVAVPLVVAGVIAAGVGLVWEAVWHRQSDTSL